MKSRERDLFKSNMTQHSGSPLSITGPNNFDIIVLDLMMPIMGGIEACQKITQVYRDFRSSRFKKVPLNDDLNSIKRKRRYGL